MSARPLSEHEYQTIIAHLANEGRIRDRFLVIFSCATGYRISEVLSLTVGQVWDSPKADVGREVTVARRKMKGGKGVWIRTVRSRRVVLAEPVRVALREYLTMIGTSDPDRPLFQTCKSHSHSMSRTQAYRVIVGAAEDCGFDSTRVSKASNLMDALMNQVSAFAVLRERVEQSSAAAKQATFVSSSIVSSLELELVKRQQRSFTKE